MIINILDILSSILMIFSLFRVNKDPKMWLIYVLACIGFLVIGVSKHLVGLSIMELVMIGVGIKNYYEIVRTK
jgi:sugar phosphate permease